MPTRDDMIWFKSTFGAEIKAALIGTPFDTDMITAIACQETGYIWATLRRKQLPLAQILALCVGDTIDFRGPGLGRQAFPRSKELLIAYPQGQQMFDIARQALEDMAAYITSYRAAAANPRKFCHGFGVFQRDLQFFKDDPDYFLERRYEQFSETLQHCLKELQRGLRKLGFQSRTSLTDEDFAKVAIAYNTGGYNPSRGLRQGHQDDGGRYYGEQILDFVTASRATGAASAIALTPGRYVVIARDGLKLRGGPGQKFESEKTLPAGTELSVASVSDTDPAWVSVDLEDDGLLDGYVFASFLARSETQATGEAAPDPN